MEWQRHTWLECNLAAQEGLQCRCCDQTGTEVEGCASAGHQPAPGDGLPPSAQPSQNGASLCLRAALHLTASASGLHKLIKDRVAWAEVPVCRLCDKNATG